jgi:predicted DNA-binding transcriptional regulator YafY
MLAAGNEPMKADRLLSTLLLLQSRGRVTGREIAKRLEVSPRTVHRDMEALSAAGVPVFALRGSGGGWQLEEDWRTQVPGLDESELRALLMAQPRVIGDGRLARAAERALGKLIASLPENLRDKATSIRQRLHVDTTGWRGARDDLSMLPIVQDAVARDRKLKMAYRRAGKDVVERAVDPLGLVAKGTTWYLVAGTADGPRTFRVSRIERAELLDEPSARPPDFDLAGFWKTSTQNFIDGLPRYETTLRVDAPSARSLRTWRPPGSVHDVADADADGRVTLRVSFECEDEARFLTLGMGAGVEVLAPAALRDHVRETAATIVARLAPVAD